MTKKKNKTKKPKKQKRKLTAAEKAAKKKRRAEYMTIFINGKQKSVKRPPTIDGIPEDDDYGQQSIWVMEMPGLGSQSELVFQVTTEASIIANPSWSPDGTKIVFNSNINLDSGLNSPLEIFTIDFDVTEAENNNAITKMKLIFIRVLFIGF